MDKYDKSNLKKRYLVWFYKSVKEALDKVERKFSQAELDKLIIKELKILDKPGKAKSAIAEFESYAARKEKDGLALKYGGKDLKPGYYFLELELKAIERTIAKEFGMKSLDEIKDLYETEMIGRILKSTEH